MGKSGKKSHLRQSTSKIVAITPHKPQTIKSEHKSSAVAESKDDCPQYETNGQELQTFIHSTNMHRQSSLVLPEQMSLTAHEHIQKYLQKYKKNKLEKHDLNAVLRLSQHLRVFGLLSAVGYVNQSNEQEGDVRKRTVPVWESLLGQMIDQNNPPDKKELMAKIVQMTAHKPQEYLLIWRKSLLLANHWNFWARAYQED